MLLNLSIRDVILIDRLDMNFETGLSVLTGETGTGKSILLDAFGLVLGARGDSALVRPNAGQAVVSAMFAVPAGHPSSAILADAGIESGDELLVRRQLGADGRSRAFVNDQPVSVGLLRQIGDTLVEIEGQFEERGLLDPATHRRVLDQFGGLGPLAAETAGAWQAWRQAAATLAQTRVAVEQARRDEEFLRHASAELIALEPRAGEEAELADLRARLMHREQIGAALSAAFTDLAGHDGAESAVHAAQRRLERVAEKAGSGIDIVLEALDRAGAELAEARTLLQRLNADLEAEPRRLEQIEERLFALRGLARKHGVAVDDLPPLMEKMAQQLAALDDQGDVVRRLREVEAGTGAAYASAAATLSAARRKAGQQLDGAVNAELPPLRLEKAQFETRIERLPESQQGEAGVDRITFEVATNPGMPSGPLAKIASGGELSRFMLAIKVALTAAGTAPTLVFDEVDAGVGGATAAAVGERLARLAESTQVLVVTHSPQVAARGAHHWRVLKELGATAAGGVGEVASLVRTRAELLDMEGRREEIARMLAGATVTDAARAAADQLLGGKPRRPARRSARA